MTRKKDENPVLAAFFAIFTIVVILWILTSGSDDAYCGPSDDPCIAVEPTP